MNTGETLKAIDHKLDQVEKIEQHLSRIVDKEAKEMKHVEHEEQRIEKELLSIGSLSIKRSHILELARGVRGFYFF